MRYPEISPSTIVSNLGWIPTSPGIWQRQADEVEKHYAVMSRLYEGSGKVSRAITGFISLSIPVDSEASAMLVERRIDTALAKAWLALRFDHPTIASRVLKDHPNQAWVKVYRRFLNVADPALWLKQSLVHIYNGHTGTEWANAVPPPPSMPTLFVVHPPVNTKGQRAVRRDLVLRAPHDTIDVIGTLLMYNNLLQHGSIAFTNSKAFIVPICDGSEIANLSPSFCAAADALPEVPPAQAQSKDGLGIRNDNTESRTSVETLSLPFKPGVILPGRHQRAAMVLSAEETSSILCACKVAGFTTTHVFHAAVAMVLRDMQKPPKTSRPVRYANHVIRNLRTHYSIPYHSREHPVSVCHSVSGQDLIIDMMLYAEGLRPLETTRQDEFLRIAQLTRKFYEDLQNEEHDAALPRGRWASLTPALPHQPRPYPVPPPSEYPSISLLDLGCIEDVIQRRYDQILVHDAWVTQEELGNGLTCYIGTFAGKLSFSSVYNEAWHDHEEVSCLLESCRTLVYEGLGLQGNY